MNDIKRNSSGERLYKDSSGANCNIRGMIRREPEWVASRFDSMMDQLAAAQAELDDFRKLAQFHNGYDSEARAAMPGLSIPESPLAAVTELVMEGKGFSDAELGSCIEKMGAALKALGAIW